MLKLIEDLPAGVVGFEAVGKVGSEDYREVMTPAVSDAVAAHGKIRVLYVLGDDYDGFTPGAMWQDAKVGMADRSAWERIAVVSDHERLNDAVGIFAFMVPGEVKTYPLDGLDEAKAWLAEA